MDCAGALYWTKQNTIFSSSSDSSCLNYGEKFYAKCYKFKQIYYVINHWHNLFGDLEREESESCEGEMSYDFAEKFPYPRGSS